MCGHAQQDWAGAWSDCSLGCAAALALQIYGLKATRQLKHALDKSLVQWHALL
jgi:hypothetical protein